MDSPKILTIVMDAERIKKVKDDKKLDFIAFSGYDKNAKKCRFKFIKDVTNLPQKEGQYKFWISSDKINRDNTSRYRTFWIKEVLKYEEYEYVARIEDLPFDEVVEDGENDNPF